MTTISGPCKGCGATDYGLSTSGPGYCGACACGTPPEVTKMRRQQMGTSGDLITALLALQVATGHKAEHMTPQMCEIGQRALDQFRESGTLPR